MQAWQMRGIANWVNGSTLLGLLVARLGRAQLQRGARDLWVGAGYRLPFPVAAAFTVGSVVVSTHPPGWDERDPVLLEHEERHATQWAVCGGLPFIGLYVAAMGWSLLRAGNPWTANIFERLAGLQSGGYLDQRR